MEDFIVKNIQYLLDKLVNNLKLWFLLLFAATTYVSLENYPLNALSILLWTLVLIRPSMFVYKNWAKIITISKAVVIVFIYYFVVLFAVMIALLFSGADDFSTELEYRSLVNLYKRDFNVMFFATIIIVILAFIYCHFATSSKSIRSSIESAEASIVISSIMSITFVFLILNNKEMLHVVVPTPHLFINELLSLLNDGSTANDVMRYYYSFIDLMASFIAISISSYTLIMKLYVGKMKKELEKIDSIEKEMRNVK